MLALSCNSVQLNYGDTLFVKDSWKLSMDNDKRSFDANVPSTVAGTLYDNGYFGKDLFNGENYFKADKSVFENPWWYRTSVRTSVPEGAHTFLKFDGISFYSDIFFNGNQLASSDTAYGVFIQREFDVTSLVSSKNDISVKIRKAEWGDLNNGFVDWAPRPLDESMGIWRDVSLRCTGDIKMDDVFVNPQKLDVKDFSSDTLEISVTLTNLSSLSKEARLHGSFEGTQFEFPVALAAGEKKTITLSPEQLPQLLVENPRVWWCQGFAQASCPAQLYNLSLECLDGETVSDRANTTFGIRKIESYIDKNNYRVTVLNGEEVLLRGAGWSDDLFLRDTHEGIENQIRYVKDMNLNCVRFENIWGKDRYVYDMCDKYGLLALVGWSCQWEWEDYCGLPETDFGCIASPKDMDLACAYLKDQVKWLRNNVSVLGWMLGSDRLPAPELEKRYLKILSLLDYRPYIGSAKFLVSDLTGPSGTKMAGPYDYVAPEYWYLDKANGGAFGFNTETGIGINLPVEESIRKMIPSDSLWPLSKSWDKHCTASSSSMGTMAGIVEPVNEAFGGAEDLKDFIKKAQFLDYESTRAMYEAFRCNVPSATGIVQWMLNSPWPSMYWQLYDWYQVPTAAYYATKAANEPVQAIYNYGDNRVYVVNETGTSVQGKLEIKLFDDRSKLISEETSAFICHNREPKQMFLLSKDRDCFISLRILGESGEEISHNFYCVPERGNVNDWNRVKWFKTLLSRFADLTFLNNLPQAQVKEEHKAEGNKLTVTLTNESDFISFQNFLKLIDSSTSEIVAPSIWSDNCFSLLPGESRTVTCSVLDGNVPSKYEVRNNSWNNR